MSTLTTVCYPGLPTTTRFPTLAVVFSITFHVALLVALNPPHLPRVKAPPVKEPPSDIYQVDLTEPPEPIDTVNKLDDPPVPTAPVPTLPDIPTVDVRATDITEEFIPSVPSPEGLTKLAAIPANLTHRTGPPDGSIIFNRDALDRQPEAVSRTAPTFPYELQRTVSEATVVVGFVITSRGEVVQPHIVSSTHSGFERSALSAIEKWKFKPGMKNGVKVNTRVEQQLSFVLTNDR